MVLATADRWERQTQPAPRAPLPPHIGYYLRHLLARRFRLVAFDGTPPALRGRAIVFTREQLTRIPESPQFQDAVKQLGPKIKNVRGWIHVPPHGAPVLLLDGVGAWTLRLPKHGKAFQHLRDLKVPADLRPYHTRESPPANGRPRQRVHSIHLPVHEKASLVIAVTLYPTGHVGYQAWVWHSALHTAIPLYWDEARRCIDLFRDLAAGWFRVEAPARRPERRTDGTPPPAPQAPAGAERALAALGEAAP